MSYVVRIEQEGFITGFVGNGRRKAPGNGTRYPHPSAAIRAAESYRKRAGRLTQLLVINDRDGSIVARR